MQNSIKRNRAFLSRRLKINTSWDSSFLTTQIRVRSIIIQRSWGTIMMLLRNRFRIIGWVKRRRSSRKVDLVIDPLGELRKSRTQGKGFKRRHQ